MGDSPDPGQLAERLRAAASPKEIVEYKRRYEEEGRSVIREEVDARLDADLDDREELVDSVTDMVVRGLERLP